MVETSLSPGDLLTRDPRARASIARYWRRNVALMTGLLAVWAAAGLGAGVLFADSLNEFRIGGFPLGFWFAQQGSIIVFVVLILVYALVMERLDRAHHAELVELDELGRVGGETDDPNGTIESKKTNAASDRSGPNDPRNSRDSNGANEPNDRADPRR